MADQVGRLEVVLDARISQFEQKVKKAEDRMRRSSGQMRKSATTAERAFQGMGKAMAAIAGPLAVGAMVRGLDRAISKLDEIGKTADRLGLTTDALQELRSAAQQSGVATNTLDMAMQRFGRRIAEARQGAGEAQNAVKELGLQLTDATGRARPMIDVFRDVADRLGRMENATDRNRLAMKFFDSEGVQLVQMFGNLDAVIEAFRQAGGPIDEEMIRNAELMRNEIDLLGQSISNVALNIVGNSALIVNNLRRWYDESSDLFKLWSKLSGFGIFGALGAPDDLPARSDQPMPGGEPFATSAAGGSAGQTDKAAEASARLTERLQEESNRWHDLSMRIGLSGDELQDLIARQEVYNMLGEDFTDLQMRMAEGLIDQRREVEELQEAQEAAAEATERHQRAMSQLASRFTDALINARSLEDGIRAVAAALIEAEMNALIQGTGTSIIGSVAGSLIGSAVGGGVKASAGGGSASPNVPMLVGERGPEMIVPRSASRVLNNAATDRAMGGGSSVTYNISAPGADAGSVERIKSVLADHVATHDQIVVGAVRKARAGRQL